VRWGNVARLAALVAAVAGIAFWPRGETRQIPFDGLPGEAAPAMPRTDLPRPQRVPRAPREPRPRVRRPRTEKLGRRAVARAVPVVRPAPATATAGQAPPPVTPAVAPRPRVPQAAREFSFDR
jgi:hypothetical protein